MQYREKNKIPLKVKIYILVGFYVCILIATKIPYINLLFPLWVIILLFFILLNMLFHTPFFLKGTILICLWLTALIFVLFKQISFAENIAIAEVILFAYLVFMQFLKEKSLML